MLQRRYCYFPQKQTDWNKVRDLYRPQATAAAGQRDFLRVVQRVCWELYDSHTGVHGLPDGIPRQPPADLLVEKVPGGLRVTAIEAESAVDEAGVAIGDTVVAVNGRSVASLTDALSPRCLRAPDPAAE